MEETTHRARQRGWIKPARLVVPALALVFATSACATSPSGRDPAPATTQSAAQVGQIATTTTAPAAATTAATGLDPATVPVSKEPNDGASITDLDGLLAEVDGALAGLDGALADLDAALTEQEGDIFDE